MNVFNLSSVCLLILGSIVVLTYRYVHIEFLDYIGHAMQLIGWIIALINLRKNSKKE